MHALAQMFIFKIWLPTSAPKLANHDLEAWIDCDCYPNVLLKRLIRVRDARGSMNAPHASRTSTCLRRSPHLQVINEAINGKKSCMT